MKVILNLLLLVLIAAAYMPAHAIWNDQLKSNGQPLYLVVQPAPSNTPLRLSGAVPSNKVPLVSVARPVQASGSWVDRAKPAAAANYYYKTKEEAKVLNQAMAYASNSPVPGAQIPEPGSIAGLSAGLFGIFLGWRRTRKHS